MTAQSLIDDFALPGLDVAKWTTTYGGVTTGPAGLAIAVPPVVNQYQDVASVVKTFVLNDSTLYARVDAVPSSGNAAMIFRRTDTPTYFLAWTFDDGTLYGQDASQGAGSTNVVTLPYNGAQHRWWKITITTLILGVQVGRQPPPTTYLARWWTSADGQLWTVQGSSRVGTWPADAEVVFETGWYASPKPAGTFIIGLFNTSTAVDRGPGILTESVDELPLGLVPVDRQFGPLYCEDDGGQPSSVQIVAGMSGRALQLAAPSGQATVVRTNLGVFTDVDMAVAVCTVSTVNGAGASDAETAQIMWRWSDVNHQYRLHLFRDYLLLWKNVAGTLTLLKYVGVGTTTGVTYRWRIVHQAQTIVVMRDSGVADSGRQSRISELCRVTDNTLPAGHVGFRAYQATALFDDLAVDVPAPTASVDVVPGKPVAYRGWGAYVAAAPSTRNLIKNPSFEPDLTGWAGVGNTLTPTTTAGTYWVGTGALRAVATGGSADYVYNVYSPPDLLVTAGLPYSASCAVKWGTGTPASLQIGIVFIDVNGSFVGGYVYGALQMATTTGWTILSFGNVPAPAGAMTARVLIRRGDAATAGDTWYADGVLCEQSVINHSWASSTVQTLIDDPTVLTNLETEIGRPFTYASWYLDGNAPYPLASAQALAASGHTNVMSWGPTGWSFASLLNKQHDDYLLALKTGIAATPGLVYLRLMPEMNGSWAGWSYLFDPAGNGVPASNGCSVQSLAQWRQVWRYIHDTINPPNVRWIFNVNETDEPRNNEFTDYYPGDDYVDVVSFDAFNWGVGGVFNWREAAEVLHDPYQRLTALTDSHPVWVTELACKEPTKADGAPVDAGHDKSAWLAAMFALSSYPRLAAIIWFDTLKERDWRLDSSPVALRASRAGFLGTVPGMPGAILDPRYNPLPVG